MSAVRTCFPPLLGVVFSTHIFAQTTIESGRMAEVFQQTILSGAGVLNDPWEIAYGPDGYLWITEAKGYKVYRMNPGTGAKTTVLNIAKGSTFLPAADQVFNVQFTATQNPWPQGGCAGLAVHPKFMDPVTPKNYVYLSYVYSYNSTAAGNGGVFFTNRVVRFTYNTSTGKLESPVSLCDTLPGSSDHNSQRMIIAPVGTTNYLFYAAGDMGAGQFTNLTRDNKAQNVKAYEGKILRFNLEPDGDAGALDKWIPNDNPFNAAAQSAVWSTGIRNNQGFAFAVINGNNYLYGSSHGPFSDDEVNIIERGKNYGHPMVIGFSSDGNYDGAKAGASGSSLPLIGSESANAATLGVTYRDPIFSFYPAPKGNTTTPWSVQYIYTNQNYTYFNGTNNVTVQAQNANQFWASEAPSGLDIYTSSVIPGWKTSLLSALLKGGRVMRLKLNASGNAIAATDTVSYFRSVNRFRDLAVAPDGKTIFAVIDKSSTTSGPTATNPVVSACAGCVIRYTFLGYNSKNGKSTIATTIPVTSGMANTCTAATTITIDANNNNFWMPLTGPDGNILAEIKANGNNLGTVTASFYTNSGAIRKDVAGKPYLDRNITITPQFQPTSGTVDVRLYITNSELSALKGVPGSGVESIADMHIYKNGDACGSTLLNPPVDLTPDVAEAFGATGNVLQLHVASFSSFYFASPKAITILPGQLVTFKGALQQNDAQLQWKTADEKNTVQFEIERRINNSRFEKVGVQHAYGSQKSKTSYMYTDKGAALLPADILYYRLKTVDSDGTFTYSKVLALHVPRNITVVVFPNPVKANLTIRISSREAQTATVQVTDVQGRVVYIGQQALQANTNTIAIDVRHWPAQLYLVKVVNDKADVLASQKFEKAE